MIISIDAEKAGDKAQHTFIIKTQYTRNRGEHPQLVKEHLLKNLQLTSQLMMKN